MRNHDRLLGETTLLGKTDRMRNHDKIINKSIADRIRGQKFKQSIKFAII